MKYNAYIPLFYNVSLYEVRKSRTFRDFEAQEESEEPTLSELIRRRHNYWDNGISRITEESPYRAEFLCIYEKFKGAEMRRMQEICKSI